MSNSDELNLAQDRLTSGYFSADRQLKSTKFGPGQVNMIFFHCFLTAKIDIETLIEFLCLFNRSSKFVHLMRTVLLEKQIFCTYLKGLVKLQKHSKNSS